MRLDEQYWNKRYEENDTPWDIGESAPAILRMVRTMANVGDHILFPGAGLGHEAQILRSEGYKNIYICDWAKTALEQIASKHDYPKQLLLHDDFFKMTGSYDLIVEMTFFCAIEPDKRQDYVDKCLKLLKHQGKLTGLLFNKQFENNPPFGGSLDEYKSLFSPHFKIKKMEECMDSIGPRLGNELEFLFVKNN